MAVAVKNTPGVVANPLQRPAVLSLLGVLYVLVCLGLAVKVVPDLWWLGWSALGFRAPSLPGRVLLGAVEVALLLGFVVVGSRLLGPRPPVGVRAGIFVGLVELLLVMLLVR